MTALEYVQDLERQLSQARIDLFAAEAMVERLKVCGNCEHIETWYEDSECLVGKWIHTMPSGQSFETNSIDYGDPCHFTPSRWTERGAP